MICKNQLAKPPIWYPWRLGRGEVPCTLTFRQLCLKSHVPSTWYKSILRDCYWAMLNTKSPITLSVLGIEPGTSCSAVACNHTTNRTIATVVTVGTIPKYPYVQSFSDVFCSFCLPPWGSTLYSRSFYVIFLFRITTDCRKWSRF